MCRWYLSRYGIPTEVNVTLAMLESEILDGDIRNVGLYYRTMDRQKAIRSAEKQPSAPCGSNRPIRNDAAHPV